MCLQRGCLDIDGHRRKRDGQNLVERTHRDGGYKSIVLKVRRPRQPKRLRGKLARGQLQAKQGQRIVPKTRPPNSEAAIGRRIALNDLLSVIPVCALQTRTSDIQPTARRTTRTSRFRVEAASLTALRGYARRRRGRLQPSIRQASPAENPMTSFSGCWSVGD